MLDHLQTLYHIPFVKLLAAAVLAIVAATLLAHMLSFIARRLSIGSKFLTAIQQYTQRPFHLLMPLLALQMVLRSADPAWPGADGLRHLVTVCVIFSITWALTGSVKAVQHFILLKHPVNISDNLRARRVHTQTKVMVRTVNALLLIIGFSFILMTFPSARQFGTSLLASAGLAGLAVGFAAKPVLGNLIAGLQIAITQPIRLDDVVIIENEWGRIEEITGTYVVVRIWDNRRLVIPLQWIIENPFQNWTRQTAELLGSVFIWVDYTVPLAAIRQEAQRLCEQQPALWRGEVCVVHVTDCNERAMQVRILMDTSDSSKDWDLRCYMRENIIDFLQRQYPSSLPKIRGVVDPSPVTASA